MREPNAQHQVQEVVEALASARQRLGWSKRKLALLAGIDPKTVGLIERSERNPTLLTLLMISNALGEDLGEILQSRPSKSRR